MDDNNSSLHNIKLKIGDRHLCISIVDIAKMHVHEKIIPSLLEKIKDSISRERVLIDPIIVDSKIGLVIDGTHRIMAMKQLGYKVIPSLNLNYKNKDVKVGRWYRILSLGTVEKIVDKYNMKRINVDELVNGLNKGNYDVGLFEYKYGYFLDGLNDLSEVSDVVEEITQLSGPHVRYVTDAQIYEFLDTTIEGNYILGYRRLFKEEILASVYDGKIFTHKFTRHIIPIRLLSINIPVKYLSDYKYIDKIISYINHLRFKYIGKNVNIDNRIYEEDVYIGKIEYRGIEI